MATKPTKHCEKCGAEWKPKAKHCHSTLCLMARKCSDCGVSIFGKVGATTKRCKHCENQFRKQFRDRYKVSVAIKKENEVRPTRATGPRCTSCPSLSKFGRCGGITRGEMQWLPAQVVRISGHCPRMHGLRSCLEPSVARLTRPPLDSHRKVCGVPGSYIDPIAEPMFR